LTVQGLSKNKIPN